MRSGFTRRVSTGCAPGGDAHSRLRHRGAKNFASGDFCANSNIEANGGSLRIQGFVESAYRHSAADLIASVRTVFATNSEDANVRWA